MGEVGYRLGQACGDRLISGLWCVSCFASSRGAGRTAVLGGLRCVL